ncbi:phospholipase D family protein [Xylella fastidiosa subsp. sandyi]|uniref:phospholipase D family protein n=1 Tax=Xylella fastidiosa TaxID=2371 RepID=UPI000FFE3B93|nr:phospholipase D family protein [Xylella fastidiosa]RWA44952.1 phospholipase D family protein [Xylella fastidiosa subsp. sandyi]
MNIFIRLLLLAAVLLGSGCASLSHAQLDYAASVAVAARPTTLDCDRPNRCALDSPLYALGSRALSESTPVTPLHYVTILDKGESALVARINLIRSATRSIDMQTYIFDKDDSARLIMDELLTAARRGVRVRLLIDQLSAISDLNILGALAGAHVNFQLRIYNPIFGKAKLNYGDYVASVLCCFRRFNQRMHNKLLVIDEMIGVVGGRNYQDDYYDWDLEYNFRDRDVLVAGPAVLQMAVNFDAFWAAERSVPVERLRDVGRMVLQDGVPMLPSAVFNLLERVQRVTAEANDPDYVKRTFVDVALAVNKVQYVADLPQKHRYEHNANPVSIGPRLDSLISNARHEVILQTPYLVLSKPALNIFRRLNRTQNKPRVVVVTNSLAATDNPIVYALFYKYKRRNMRDLGFDIYEYKPFPENPPIDLTGVVPIEGWNNDYLQRRQDLLAATKVSDDSDNAHQLPQLENKGQVDRRVLRTETRPPFWRIHTVNKPLPVTRPGARMGLHAKSLVVDRKVGVIGTHNFDPRSESYNTEAVVVIEDPAFAGLLASSIEGDIAPGNAWVVAPRKKLPGLYKLNYSVGKLSEALPVLDLWPWRYATNYEFKPGLDCPIPLPRRDPNFMQCYEPVGDFPEVNVGPKWLLVRMLIAFGAGLVPIL